MKTRHYTTAALALTFLAAGCSKENDPKIQLESPVFTYEVVQTATEYSFSWNAVENAETYSYKLATEDGTVVDADEAYTKTSVSISGLQEETAYVFSLQALSSNPKYLPSPEVSEKFTTGAIPRAAAPEFRNSCKTDIGVCVTWLPSTGSFKYKLAATAEPDAALSEDTVKDSYLTFSGLKASTSYTVTLQALAEEGSGLADSRESTFEFTTDAVATKPWTSVVFEYHAVGGKNTIICHNVPNSLVEHYYTSTEDHDVIGSGQASEADYAKYMIWDYEDNMPGIYCDTPIHKFGNGNVGWKKGDHLFYGAVSADKNEKTRTANWFYLEVPENENDDMIIVNSHKD